MRATRASLLARVGSAAAVAVLAGGGVVATATAASAATHHHLLRTHLSIRNKVISHGRHHADAVSGVLKHGRKDLANEMVTLDSRTAKKPRWTKVASGPTGSNGAVSFTVTPTTRTQYKLVFGGDTHFRRSHSDVITLKAVKKG